MANDSGVFLDNVDVAPKIISRRGALAVLDDGTEVYPLYEGKMLWHFDHRYGTYEGQTEKQANKGVLPHVSDAIHDNPEYRIEPRYWVSSDETAAALGEHGDLSWCFAWRDVGPTERTLVGCLIPKTAAGDKAPFLVSKRAPREVAGLVGILSSFVVDYDARQRTSGGMKFFVVEQLPVLPPSFLVQLCSWLGASPCDWLTDRVLELSYTNVELSPFAHDLGNDFPPFRWNPERRVILQAEIDALVFHLYGLKRDQVEWVLDSFFVLRKYEESDHGEYRTKRVILEIYDAMAEAMRTGIPYQTRLSPPPADPSVAHPWPAEMPRQPQITPNPMEALTAVANAAWATPLGVSPDNVALFTLIEVMRLLCGPVDAERVRVSANLVRNPAIATAFMEDPEAREWERAVGQEAQPLRANVIQISQFQQGASDLPWAEAVRQLQGSGAIVIGTDGKWSAGPRLPATSKQDWIHGRAAVAVHLLSVIEPAAAETKILAFIRSVEDGTARRAVS
jgi:hypothetical protein